MRADDSTSPPQKRVRGARLAGNSLFRKRLLTVISGLALASLMIAIALWPRDNIFSINVSTEVIAITINDPVLAEWELPETRLIVDPFDDIATARLIEDRAWLIIEPDTRVRLQRHGTGPLRILLTVGDESSKSGKSVGSIEPVEGPPIDLGDWALLLAKVVVRPTVFPFRGQLTAGDDIAVGVNSILLGGTVSVVEEQLLGKTRYIAGEETLDAGDRVALWLHPKAGSDKPRPATVSGFVRVEAPDGFNGPNNAMNLVAHGQADFAKIERLGSSGYLIRKPRWARFLRDPLLAASTAVIALLALLLELFSKCGTLVGDRSKPEDSGGQQTGPPPKVSGPSDATLADRATTAETGSDKPT